MVGRDGKLQSPSEFLALRIYSGNEFRYLLSEIEEVFRVNGRDVLAFEMFVLVALEFDLKLKDEAVFPHYQRVKNGI